MLYKYMRSSEEPSVMHFSAFIVAEAIAEYLVPLTSKLNSLGSKPLRVYANFLKLFLLSHPLSSIQISGPYILKSFIYCALKTSDCCRAMWQITLQVHPINFRLRQMVGALKPFLHLMQAILSNSSLNNVHCSRSPKSGSGRLLGCMSPCSGMEEVKIPPNSSF